jgi:hypothetical protein
MDLKSTPENFRMSVKSRLAPKVATDVMETVTVMKLA